MPAYAGDSAAAAAALPLMNVTSATSGCNFSKSSLVSTRNFKLICHAMPGQHLPQTTPARNYTPSQIQKLRVDT
eukprot:COSAG05_NODE_138_length_16837_cov_344.961286_20_plen_74_part_00